MTDLRDNIASSSHYSSVYFSADQLGMVLFYPLLSSVDVLAFNIFTKKLLFVETFVEHMRPIIYLSVNSFHVNSHIFVYLLFNKSKFIVPMPRKGNNL